MCKDENGNIIVETTFALTLYVMLMIFILSLINIVTLQARVHYALTQTALTVSMYSYMFEVTGIASRLRAIDYRSTTGRETIRGVVDTVNTASDMLSNIGSMDDVNLDDILETGQNTMSHVMPWLENPDGLLALIQEMLRDTGNAVISELWVMLVEMMVRPLIGWHLSNGDMSGDEFLLSANVIGGLDGLRFRYPHHDDGFLLNLWGGLSGPEGDRTIIIDHYGNIRIFVQYDVDFFFGLLPLPFTRMTINQSVVTKAWLSGFNASDRSGYRFSDGTTWNGVTNVTEERRNDE